jgi:hypothetical protein
MRTTSLNKVFNTISKEEVERCLAFARRQPPPVEDIKDRDIEADLFLQSSNKSVARVQIYRILESDKDDNPAYTFHVSVHEASPKGKIINHGTFTQDELSSFLKERLEKTKELTLDPAPTM